MCQLVVKVITEWDQKVKGRTVKTNNQLVSLSMPSRKLEHIQQDALEDMSKCMKDRDVIRDIQQGFNKGKPQLTNLTAFYNGVIASTDKETAVGVICLDF